MQWDHEVLGRHTLIPLDHTAPFFLPFETDPFGALRPALTVEAMRLSLELAATSYNLDVSQWLLAGWTDVSVQSETRLYTGMRRPSFAGDKKAYAKNAWELYRSRRGTKSAGPVAQVRGALRQRKASDSGKALVMAKKHDEGQYVIAIGFMGTSTRVYDWFSNFRMTSLDGFHKGFLQLARQLAANEEKILFPDVAQELGLERLTLADILSECRQKDSRFRLWLSGHSQGGAVLQVYAHLKLLDDGVLPENLVGYGFASPSAALLGTVKTPSAYPLYHIFNSDDLVPRMGSRVHLGLMLSYPSGQAIRQQCYAWPMDAQSVYNRIRIRRLTRRMVDTPSCIESGLCYLEILFSRPAEEIFKVLGELQMRFLPVRQMLALADKRGADVLRFIQRRGEAAYQDMTGQPIDREKLRAVREEMAAMAEEMGMVRFTASLMQCMMWAHTLVARENASMGSYEYIVRRGTEALHASIWASGEEPLRRWAGEAGAAEVPAGAMALHVRRSPKALAPRRMHSPGKTRPRRRG